MATNLLSPFVQRKPAAATVQHAASNVYALTQFAQGQSANCQRASARDGWGSRHCRMAAAQAN